MGYFFFICPTCDRGLIMNDQSRLAASPCPECNHGIRIPPPSVWFPCPYCYCELSASEISKKKMFSCPQCEKPIQIPANSIIRCQRCNILMEVDDSYFRELWGSSVDCPCCGAVVKIQYPPGITVDVTPPRDAGAEPAPHTFDPSKTMQLDIFLPHLPQAQAVKNGLCPYCSMKLQETSDTSFVCRRCNRAIAFTRQS